MSSVQLKKLPTKPVRGSQIGGKWDRSIRYTPYLKSILDEWGSTAAPASSAFASRKYDQVIMCRYF